jgi:hypothetical protein
MGPRNSNVRASTTSCLDERGAGGGGGGGTATSRSLPAGGSFVLFGLVGVGDRSFIW